MTAPMLVNATSLDFNKNNPKKVNKKLNRCRHTLRKLDNIDISEEPTNILCVFNGGLDTGVSREELEGIFSEDAVVENIIMLPRRPYSFICYLQVQEALRACSRLNGTKLRNRNQLYISFVKNVPVCSFPSGDLPPGLILEESFISEDYEKQLLELIDWDCEDMKAENTLKHRRVKHFGYEFKYGINNVDPEKPLSCGIPKECDKLLLQLQRLGFIGDYPDQLTVNQYLPGQGIPPHVDTPSAFEDGIVSLSLGSQVVMDFEHPDGRQRSVVLPRRSVLIMSGESRYIWTHGITPRKSDIVPLSDGALTLVQRKTRTSFTFRKLVNPDHQVPCNITNILNSEMDKNNKKSIEDMPGLPMSDLEASQLEVLHVHKVYNEIAEHFSRTRHSPWPKVTEFLCALPNGSLVADLGCGNGKYFGLNTSIFQIGSDRSANLVEICRERNFQAFIGDVLAIPLRSNAFDAAICIAVIHHLSTKKRRLKAIEEILRILRPGGRALIQVWAMEQEKNQQHSKYLKKNPRFHNHVPEIAKTNTSLQQDDRETLKSSGPVSPSQTLSPSTTNDDMSSSCTGNEICPKLSSEAFKEALGLCVPSSQNQTLPPSTTNDDMSSSCTGNEMCSKLSSETFQEALGLCVPSSQNQTLPPSTTNDDMSSSCTGNEICPKLSSEAFKEALGLCVPSSQNQTLPPSTTNDDMSSSCTGNEMCSKLSSETFQEALGLCVPSSQNQTLPPSTTNDDMSSSCTGNEICQKLSSKHFKEALGLCVPSSQNQTLPLSTTNDDMSSSCTGNEICPKLSSEAFQEALGLCVPSSQNQTLSPSTENDDMSSSCTGNEICPKLSSEAFKEALGLCVPSSQNQTLSPSTMNDDMSSSCTGNEICPKLSSEAFKEALGLCVPSSQNQTLFPSTTNDNMSSSCTGNEMCSKLLSEPFQEAPESSGPFDREFTSPPKLAVHVNRTTFKQQDLLVPWTKKNKRVESQSTEQSVLHRFYHVFQEGELEHLCAGVDSALVSQSYYDEGNWCVVLTKKGSQVEH